MPLDEAEIFMRMRSHSSLHMDDFETSGHGMDSAPGYTGTLSAEAVQNIFAQIGEVQAVIEETISSEECDHSDEGDHSDDEHQPSHESSGFSVSCDLNGEFCDK